MDRSRSAAWTGGLDPSDVVLVTDRRSRASRQRLPDRTGCAILLRAGTVLVMAEGDLDLWVLTAEAVLARGRGLEEAILTADRVIAAYWRNARRQRKPGLAKCGRAGVRGTQRRYFEGRA